MNLRDFITQTLLDVVEGVANAQENLTQGRGSISPTQGPHNPYQNVDFDLAVTADEAGADGGIIIVARTNDAAGTRERRSEISRIQFTVPVRLPTKSA